MLDLKTIFRGRDATAIKAPEKPEPKPAPVPKVPGKRGRLKKGEVRPPAPSKRLDLQPTRPLAENLADLPTRCNVRPNATARDIRKAGSATSCIWTPLMETFQ